MSVRTFSVMYDHTFLNLQITRSDIRPYIKWTVSLVIAYSHFDFPQGFVWVRMAQHTHFITPEEVREVLVLCIESILYHWSSGLHKWLNHVVVSQ